MNAHDRSSAAGGLIGARRAWVMATPANRAAGRTSRSRYAASAQRALTFNTGARNTVVGADPITSFTTSATNASVVSNPAAIVKQGQTLSAVPKFEYRVGNFMLEAFRALVGEFVHVEKAEGTAAIAPP